jgi:trimethylamine--corrinoid protein Co-methyltransferase
MTDTTESRPRRRRHGEAGPAPSRQVSYHPIFNRLPHPEVFSADQVAAIHDTALRVLEELGIRVLHAEGRRRYRGAGAMVDEDSQMVRIDRGLVAAALATVPVRFTLAGGGPGRDIPVGGNSLMFTAGAGCPNITDLERGRRPGTLADFIETTKLQQSFAILPKLAPAIEAQDVPVALRHLETMRLQLTLSDKVPFVYARGRGQVLDSFEMLRIARGVDAESFRATPHTFTVINTNSPRMLDRPMAQGIIDFAEWGQPTVITPFCLLGAMAPITIAGALTLSHAEALAGIVLAQIVRPGAPVVYGSFASNVDMKSGAPAFGTPEHIQSNFGAGQLARHIGLPWRSAAGTASNAPDVQGGTETQLALWGAVLAGANMIFHACGWLEGGLTHSLEKFITDIEAMQTIAEIMQPVACGPDEIGFGAIAEVDPGGHFFAATQTMERYRTAFYQPLVADWSNFGQWTGKGAKTATERARDMWKRRLAEFEPPPVDPGMAEALDDFVARRTAEGGASPMD